MGQNSARRVLADALRTDGIDPNKVIGVEIVVPARGPATMKLEMFATPTVLRALGYDETKDEGK